MSENKKKIFGPLEIFTVLLVIALLAYMAMKNGGISIMERTETVEILDKPNNENRQPRKYRPTEEEHVDNILRQIADQYAGKPSQTNTQVRKEAIKKEMSPDEMAYLESVKQKEQKKSKQESIDWFTVLSTSHKTYKRVKSVFEKAGIDVGQAEANVGAKLVDEVAARTFYSKMEELFDIPEEEARAFAGKGEKALSDWARFVDEKGQ